MWLNVFYLLDLWFCFITPLITLGLDNIPEAHQGLSGQKDGQAVNQSPTGRAAVRAAAWGYLRLI